MKLFVYCIKCKYKIYVTHNATVRRELPPSFELTCSNCGTHHIYNPWLVMAEAGLTTIGGMLLGGLLGLPLGGPGALLGAILGGILGKSSEEQDVENVRRFNNS
ncbi:MAG: hypothetical protein WD033_01845 [Nitrosopumilaceae archaeon]